jgi:SAM-dependent methyltransferase
MLDDRREWYPRIYTTATNSEHRATRARPRGTEVNPFDHPTVAARYALGRPPFHRIVIDRIVELLRLEQPVARALDVGCGTGLSTRDLRLIAEQVVGLDSSAAMLACAEPAAGVSYVHGSAEDMPVESGMFDLVTVSSAFHWFNRTRVLGKVSRVLTPGGHLVIYENAFGGEMSGQQEFRVWQQAHYARYPRTARDTTPFTDEEAARHGLRFLIRERYTNTVEFTPTDLSLYLSTQTNAIEAIERGGLTVADFRAAVEREVAPFFSSGVATVVFEGFIWCLQKPAD